MAVAIGAWSLKVPAGSSKEIIPVGDIKLTNVSLGDVLVDEKGRTSLKMSIPKLEQEDEDDEQEFDTVIICSLTPGKIEQATTDIFLIQNNSYKVEAVGKNTLFLAGYYTHQADESDMDFDSDSDEDEHDLRFVSSDVEMPLDDLEMDSDASRFEEVDDGAEQGDGQAKSLKRPLDSAEGDKPVSKAEKKKNKKQKLQDGTAAPAEEAKADQVADKEKKDKKDKKEKKEKVTAMKELPSGLKIQDAKIGTGPMAKNGQTVLMRYIGKLTQGGKKFDENISGKPFSFRLGAGQVIKGWDEGIVGIQAGGERVLVVPAALGYGKKGSGPIPPNASLTFEVKCIQIKK